MLEDFIKQSVEEAVKKYIEANIATFAKQSNHDTLMDIGDAAKLLNVSEKWLYKNAHALPFAIKLSTKMWRFSKKKLEKFLEAGMGMRQLAWVAVTFFVVRRVPVNLLEQLTYFNFLQGG